jgi:hypothetical protein
MQKILVVGDLHGHFKPLNKLIAGILNGGKVNYGKSLPVASNDEEAGRAQNRRVVSKRLE